ncbi:MAG TPA: thioredoxin domain-containing protein [Thermoplasmata archaeon]|nr:thioredoxin domain-containing protein [Thermoplasmata archaeon]
MTDSGAPAPTGLAWRLARSPSLYLRGASEQSISWRPWGPEAFEEASRQRKPILLDIGAAWCHWCHVMDEGTYSDTEVARLIEQHFIAVKVDRDLNPEIDRRYQRQVGSLTGEGGWPLTAFLTPQGEVYFGGTYFPVQDAMGRPGFRRVLREMARIFRDEPGDVEQNTRAVREALDRSAHASLAPGVAAELSAAVRQDLAGSFDPTHAGFGQAPKFPHPTAISFLLVDSSLQHDPASAERARQTLLQMADGGMYDQIGGGFHRYSVDEGWHIPHFEKMGVDNAALLDAYVEGVRRFGEPRFESVVRETVAWSREVLGDPAGGFGASQDADNAPGDDGSYFTWSRAELRALLDPTELRLLTRFYGVGSDGRMPHDPDRNVLFRLLTVNEAREGSALTADQARSALERAREKLRAARSTRSTPAIDRALYAHINGGFVRAFAHAGQLLQDATIVADARRAADRFLERAYRPGAGVAHFLDASGASGFGLLHDQAEFALGLVELGGVTAEPRYIRAAGEILETTLREFAGENGLLRDLAPKLYDGPTVASIDRPTFPVEDTPHLSANAACALALVRLGAITNDKRWTKSARTLVGALAGRLAHTGLFAAGTALAGALLEVAPARVVVEGEGADADALLRSAHRSWYPLLYSFRGTPPAPFSLPGELGDGKAPIGPRALICFGTRCLAPITSAAEIAPALSGSSS